MFYPNFKNIPCFVTSEVGISLKRFCFALSDDGLTLTTLKIAYIGIFKLFVCLFVKLRCFLTNP